MGLAFGPKRPSRGPRTMVAASATQPPTEWTTVEPAKSMNPRLLSQPLGSPDAEMPQAQWP